jgi:hypothetical protein
MRSKTAIEVLSTNLLKGDSARGVRLHISNQKVRVSTVTPAFNSPSILDAARATAIILSSEKDLDHLLEALEGLREPLLRALKASSSEPKKKGKKTKKGKTLRRRDGQTTEIDSLAQLKDEASSFKLSSREGCEAFLSMPAIKPFCKKGFKAVKAGRVEFKALQAFAAKAKSKVLKS